MRNELTEIEKMRRSIAVLVGALCAVISNAIGGWKVVVGFIVLTMAEAFYHAWRAAE